jgi:hypothetical protein
MPQTADTTHNPAVGVCRFRLLVSSRSLLPVQSLVSRNAAPPVESWPRFDQTVATGDDGELVLPAASDSG